MPVVPCFGCTRWEGGWDTRAEASEERVWIHATDFSKRKTRDVAGDVEHDAEGRRWFRPRRLREHKFYLCVVCCYLFDGDSWFKELISKKVSGLAGGGE